MWCWSTQKTILVKDWGGGVWTPCLSHRRTFLKPQNTPVTKHTIERVSAQILKNSFLDPRQCIFTQGGSVCSFHIVQVHSDSILRLNENIKYRCFCISTHLFLIPKHQRWAFTLRMSFHFTVTLNTQSLPIALYRTHSRQTAKLQFNRSVPNTHRPLTLLCKTIQTFHDSF